MVMCYDMIVIMLMFEDWMEICGMLLCILYVVLNYVIMYWIVLLNVGMLMFMCVFGEVFGLFVLELVMDEFVWWFGMDLVVLWFVNYVEVDL